MLPYNLHTNSNNLYSGLQTDDSKSTGQEVGDKVGRSHDQHAHGGTGESILDKAKSAIGMDKK